MIGALAFAFGAGSVATVNPCGFALLPANLARRLAMDDGAGTTPETIARALAAGAAMTLGFLLVFGVGERLSSTLRAWLGGTMGQAVTYVILTLLLTLSVWALSQRRLSKTRRRRKEAGLLSGLRVGRSSSVRED